MSFKDQMAADAAAMMDTVGGFGEWVTYNGQRIAAVFEQGAELQRGNEWTPTVISDGAVVHVLETAVPDPKAGDVIVREDYPDKQWRVNRVLETAGGLHRLECTADEFAFGRR
jgi:hypothetical protein